MDRKFRFWLIINESDNGDIIVCIKTSLSVIDIYYYLFLDEFYSHAIPNN